MAALTENITIKLSDYIHLKNCESSIDFIHSNVDKIKRHYLLKLDMLQKYIGNKEPSFLISDYVYQNQIIEMCSIAEFLLSCGVISMDEFEKLALIMEESEVHDNV